MGMSSSVEECQDGGALEDGGEGVYETLTAAYERLRHCEDSEELSAFARRPLPDRDEQAAFSRATALLEAVAGNAHTPVDDRVYLARTMPFPNVLVKLSMDDAEEVRQAVAANVNAKNWLVGRLAKDASLMVRDAALRNPQASWKVRLEGAQDSGLDGHTLDFLAGLGVAEDVEAPVVLAAMVRRAVALNPHASTQTVSRLMQDESDEVRRAAMRSRQ